MNRHRVTEQRLANLGRNFLGKRGALLLQLIECQEAVLEPPGDQVHPVGQGERLQDSLLLLDRDVDVRRDQVGEVTRDG